MFKEIVDDGHWAITKAHHEPFVLRWAKKEKMLVTHSIFYPFQTRFQFFILSSANTFNLDQSKILSFGKELSLFKQFVLFLKSFLYCFVDWTFNPFPNKPWFLCVCSTSLLKTLREKEKLLITSNFFFSHSVFYLFGKLSSIFIKYKIVVCKLFQFRRV